MSPPPAHDPIEALNQVLSEVIDTVQEVKQAHVKVPETQALHVELDRLFSDLRAWAQLLLVEDETLGVSALASMPSVAGRTPANFWPGRATDDEVRGVVSEHLDKLGRHVAAALEAQTDSGSRAVLAEIEDGLRAHSQALGQR